MEARVGVRCGGCGWFMGTLAAAPDQVQCDNPACDFYQVRYQAPVMRLTRAEGG